MTDPLTNLRAELRAEAKYEGSGGYVEVTSRDLLALLDLLDETEAKLLQPAPLTPSAARHLAAVPEVADELAAKREARQLLVHLRSLGGRAIAACGQWPAEHMTIHREAVTCKRCLA